MLGGDGRHETAATANTIAAAVLAELDDPIRPCPMPCDILVYRWRDSMESNVRCLAAT
jgi:hypothetical protein